mgnify:CR=1 FL=1
MPASLSSAWAYRKEVMRHPRWTLMLVIAAFIGGITGGLLLLATSNAAFAKLIPWLLLIATGYASASDASPPTWTIVSCYAAIGLGTMFGGWRIVKTMGQKITKLKPVGGFCAETGGAITLFLATMLGIPVSTTHTKTSAIMGVGAVRRLSAINFGVVRDMMLTWVFTFPGCGLISFVMAKLFMVVF